MNKAFVKDDDTWEDPLIRRDPQADIPTGRRNYMTPRGARLLREEQYRLVHQDRPLLLEDINTLSRKGSEPDNPIVRDKRKALQRLENRIAFLNGRLAVTDIIDPSTQHCDHVRFGATVTVTDGKGLEKVYTIVGIDEADTSLGLISWTSPLAQALLEAREGDVIKVSTPAGEEELDITVIRYGNESLSF
jgi:transcription elongation factor GreB